MAENHGAPKAGQLLRVWTRGRTETKGRHKVSGAESVAGQCRMIWDECPSGAAGWILDSANPRETAA